MRNTSGKISIEMHNMRAACASLLSNEVERKQMTVEKQKKLINGEFSFFLIRQPKKDRVTFNVCKIVTKLSLIKANISE